tara:strand:+ start:830 stop:1624 length:795 start_codon:yes stop_codon:yes gene_type:complete
MTRPVIAFITDFGTRDHYAGSMKGVVLSICPEAAIVDITHDIPPHDVLAGALELVAVYKYFPKGTIFLVVIDPGVGSNRRALVVDTGKFRFVVPDNGLMTLVCRESPPTKIIEVIDQRYTLSTVSKTFEGRDRFAPIAAWVAQGIQLQDLGKSVKDCKKIEIPEVTLLEKSIKGIVLRVDHFGNLVTNINRSNFEKLASDDSVQVMIEGKSIGPIVNTYSDVNQGQLCALFGSTGHLEVAANGVSVVEKFGWSFGTEVCVMKLL